MNEAPGRHRLRIVLARQPVGADDTPERFENGAGRLIKPGVFRSLDQYRPEHQAEETTLLQGEFDIGETDRIQRIGPGRRRLHRRGKLSEALRRYGSEEIFLVGEMTIGGCRRHADPAGGFPQPDGVWAVFVQDRARGCAQSVRQIAMAIGATWERIHLTSHALSFAAAAPLAALHEPVTPKNLSPLDDAVPLRKTAFLRLLFDPVGNACGCVLMDTMGVNAGAGRGPTGRPAPLGQQLFLKNPLRLRILDDFAL